MKWLKRFSHRFWLWVGEKIEHHRTLGQPGFEAVCCGGKRMEPDVEAVDGFMADTLWGVPIDDSTDVAEYGGLEPAPKGSVDAMIRKGYDKH